MKPSTPNFTAAIAAAFIAAATSAAFAQATASTDPIGFMTSTIPGGSASTPVNRALSLPLYRAAIYTAATSEVTASTCRVIGGNFGTPSPALDVTTTPHLLRVKSSSNSAHVGRFFLITAGSGDQLTVDTQAGAINLTTFVSVGDSCEVVPANTLGSVFGTTTPVAGLVTGTSANGADNVFIWNGSAWETFFHNGTAWRKTGSFQPQNNAVIYPDEGFFISHVGASSITLVGMGTVPTTTERTDLKGAGASFIPNRFPVDMQLGALGLHSSPGWTSGASANAADNVYLWNGTGWDTFFYNGTNWKKTGTFQNQDTLAIVPAGTAIFVTRLNATASTLTQPLPYTLQP